MPPPLVGITDFDSVCLRPHSVNRQAAVSVAVEALLGNQTEFSSQPHGRYGLLGRFLDVSVWSLIQMGITKYLTD